MASARIIDSFVEAYFLLVHTDHGSTSELYGWCTQWLNVWQNQYPVAAPPPREESPRSVTTLPPEFVAQLIGVYEASHGRAPPAHPVEKVNKKGTYNDIEKEFLLKMTCNRNLDGLGVESLPPFWQDLEKHRGTHQSTRTYLEKFFQAARARNPTNHRFLLSHKLVLAFKELRLDQGDQRCSVESMMMGLSIFALAPYQLSDLGKRMGRSLKIADIESYMDNHGASDKAALSEIVGNKEPIPTTWERVKDYI